MTRAQILISAFALWLAVALGGSVADADTIISVTQTSYDGMNRPICSTVRMNPSVYSSLPSDPCALGPKGSDGNDRVTKNTYDLAGQLLEVDQAVGVTMSNGSTNQRAYARYSYTPNGMKRTETDANGNQTTYVYDGFDRLYQLQYPSTTLSAGTSDATDYEQFSYDPNGNKLSWRRRNGKTISYAYDSLNHEIVRSVSDGSVPTVYSTYNPVGELCAAVYSTDITQQGSNCTALFASITAPGIHNEYDGLGRLTETEDMNSRTITYTYNQSSARTQVKHPDGVAIGYSLDNADRMIGMGWNGTTGLVSQSYDSLGRRHKLLKGAVIATSESGDTACVTQTNATCYAYDNFDRLVSLSNDLNGTADDITWSFTHYTPANELTSLSASSTVYDYNQQTSGTTASAYNGLNQDAGIAATNGGGFDGDGNLINDGTRVMTYDVYNRLLTATNPSHSISLTYDPLGRVATYTADGTSTDFLYDGTDLIGEYSHCTPTSCSLAPNERYIHGIGTDEPLVWFHGSDTSNERFFEQNHQGSVIAYTDASGNATELYKYDPYGVPLVAEAGNPTGVTQTFTGARFRYTGQTVMPEVGLYNYKARVYDPAFGRFLQTDPIGSKDDLDLYAYTADDPVDRGDPTGTEAASYSVYGRGPDVDLSRVPAWGWKAAGTGVTVLSMADGIGEVGVLLKAGATKLGEMVAARAVPEAAVSPMARGVANEAKVLGEMGLTKNTQAVATAEGKAIPDALTKTASVEVKDTARVSATTQVRIQTDAAAASGRQSVLVTGEKTTVTGPAQQRFDQIIRRSDLGPQ